MKIIKTLLFWRLGLFLITYLGSLAFEKVPNGGIGAVSANRQFNYLLSWAQWDGGHYYSIAKQGYISLEDYAFFPLFPYLIKIIDLFFNNLILSGLLLTNIAFLLFLLVFYQLVKNKYSPQIAPGSIATFLVFPTTFFAVSYYSESIFLLLTALVFLFLKSRNYLLASLATSLASLTRPLGIFLVISVFYSFAKIRFKLKPPDRTLLHIFVAPFGFVIYNLYLFSRLNDPFKFLSIQSSWERSITDPISTILSYIWSIYAQDRPLYDYFDLMLTLLFLTILILGRKKIPSSWWIFSMLVILIPASTGTLTSMPRYLLSSLGAFVILGQYLVDKPRLRLLVWVVSLVIQSILAVRFINGYWVA